MTSKEFFNKVVNGHSDPLQIFLDLLKKEHIRFCVIGGLGVNAYAEPVVSLDLDLVIVAEKIDQILAKAKGIFKIEHFANSINLSYKNSDLRIQIQTDRRYQAFLKGKKIKNILGYHLPVASIEDIFQGKVWAASDEKRRPSKRQKDLADILRLIEVKPGLRKFLPEKLKNQLQG